MKKINHIAFASALSSSLLLAGCGGSSSDSDASENSNTSDVSISGTASAPAATVAFESPPGAIEFALSFFISPAAAAVTGLDPIEGATVELIRVDNEGNQVGEVLATSVTSITGDYELTLPQNVNLAGNLIVRITGQNDTALRAQVVDQDVDISPVSEFVLRKFISQGAELDQLVVTDVVKLEGSVEEFDLSLSDSANLEQAFAALEDVIGDFVENEVAVAKSDKGDGSAITGNYRSAAFSFALHDSENNEIGTYANDLWTSTFSFTNNGNGSISVTHIAEDSSYGSLSGSALNQSSVYYEVGSEDIDESFPATLTDSGILSISGEFEEEISGDHGWRYPAHTYNLQQVTDTGLFFVLSNEAAVRYATVDSNSDGEKDAVEPQQKTGDEVFRSLEVFSRQPEAFQNSDLTGNFGRVFVESWLAGGVTELATETNILSFGGDGTYDYGQVSGHQIGLEATGPTYSSLSEAAEVDQPLAITANGDITSAGGEPADGFINDAFNFMAFAEAEGDQYNAEASQTLLVKLPETAPTVTGNQYRMLLTSMKLGSGEDFLMSSSKFNTYLTMTSETAGTIGGAFFEVRKSGLAGDINVTTDTVETQAVVSLGGAGKTSITIAGADGTTVLDGFFNEDASLGIFTLKWQETNEDPDELGLVVLIKTSE
ncbi:MULTISPECIES: hypothetical protein [Marinobacter]|uniref:hypothetical protein n=1 Tax=Marinobacter TaxID=2742 RepID=UPI0010A99FD4|nr:MULTISPECIES: hypothetical protein [Marinobacter]MBJ7300502.1 hypothetical protein [Marinobacter salarius]MDC8457174.1 hypothetical protein [Marinobacter sp. DS40M6]VVT20295.1 conserved exported hypothetical protein [Marinobacter salarius]VXB84739.1 conserved exported hypothetical protein [Marinobacter salarius]HIO31512.1 hypothetical protein [Marinobacter salarius]